MLTETYVYDDQDPAQPPRRRPGTPARVLRVIQSPAYTVEDRALLTGLGVYEDSLCNCGIPREIAWHSEMDGWFDNVDHYVCHACTARRGDDKKAIYVFARHSRDLRTSPLPPFQLGVTTSDS